VADAGGNLSDDARQMPRCVAIFYFGVVLRVSN